MKNMSEKLQMQANGLKWLYEMQLVNDPQLINNLKMNLIVLSKYIKEIEILASQSHKHMLIYFEMGPISRYFFSRKIEAEALDILNQLLPEFRFRITFDRDILDLAVDKVKAVMAALPKGDENEDDSNIDGGSSTADSSSKA